MTTECDTWKKLCDNCIHGNVCKHKEKWMKYCEEYYEMRKRSSLFDDSPICCVEFIDKKEIVKNCSECKKCITHEHVSQNKATEKKTKEKPRLVSISLKDRDILLHFLLDSDW